MKNYSLTHLADHVLLGDLRAIVTRDRCTTAEMLAHLAEVDARKLYLPAAYPSMYAYCVGELRLSEDAAYKRIQAARSARQFPAIFDAVAEGRLHLSGVVLLAPHLTSETADDLLAAGTHKSKSAIEQLLADRYPKPDLGCRVQAIAPVTVAGGHAVEHRVELQPQPGSEPVCNTQVQLAPGQVAPQATPAPRARLAPLAPQRFALQVALSQQAHDKLRYAQELMGHAVPSGDIAQVLERALDALTVQLERRKFAAASASARPSPRCWPSAPRRHRTRRAPRWRWWCSRGRG